MSTSTNLFSGPQRLPFAQRIKVEVTVGALKVAATLMDSTEVDKLIRILEANKLLLTEEMGEA